MGKGQLHALFSDFSQLVTKSRYLYLAKEKYSLCSTTNHYFTFQRRKTNIYILIEKLQLANDDMQLQQIMQKFNQMRK